MLNQGSSLGSAAVIGPPEPFPKLVAALMLRRDIQRHEKCHRSKRRTLVGLPLFPQCIGADRSVFVALQTTRPVHSSTKQGWHSPFEIYVSAAPPANEVTPPAARYMRSLKRMTIMPSRFSGSRLPIAHGPDRLRRLVGRHHKWHSSEWVIPHPALE